MVKFIVAFIVLFAITGCAGDLFGPVVQIADLDPAAADAVELVLNRRAEPRQKIADTETVKLVEYESRLLSEFWGRPVVMRAGVVLPPSFATSPDRRYPACYRIHGFGGSHTGAWGGGPALGGGRGAARHRRGGCRAGGARREHQRAGQEHGNGD